MVRSALLVFLAVLGASAAASAGPLTLLEDRRFVRIESDLRDDSTRVYEAFPSPPFADFIGRPGPPENEGCFFGPVGQVCVGQRSTVTPTGMSGSGGTGAFGSKADTPPTVRNYAISQFEIVFEVTNSIPFTVSGQLQPYLDFSSRILLRSADSSTLIDQWTGVFSAGGVLPPDVYTLLIYADVEQTGPACCDAQSVWWFEIAFPEPGATTMLLFVLPLFIRRLVHARTAAGFSTASCWR